MIISDVIKKLCTFINYIIDIDGEKYKGDFIPILYKHKFSSSINDTVRIKNGDKIFDLKGTKVEYICPNCNENNLILLKRFLSKKTIKCSKCKEDEEKSKKHSEYIQKSLKDNGVVLPKIKKSIKRFHELNSDELIKISIEEFNKESEYFKIDYFNRVPTIEEFDKIKSKIKIDNIDINKSIYYPFIKTNHSKKYSPKILDQNGKLHLLSSVSYICDSCSKIFIGRNIKNKSKNWKVLCKDCSLCNKTFKVRHTLNIMANIVRYQSKPELDLINYCNVNSILIENGPDIIYEFNNRKLKYKVDFKIKNILIEIKEDHIWHKNEILSGKWKAKESAAIEYCKLNKMEYKLVMKNQISELKKIISKYNWIIKKP
jgi:hypothetical protein